MRSLYFIVKAWDFRLDKMNFDSASQIITQIYQMLIAQQPVMRNRSMINALFNGDTPWTAAAAEQENIGTNINWLEPTRIAQNARNQIDAATFRSEQFATWRLDRGPRAYRDIWSHSISSNLNKELKKSKRYRATRAAAHAQVVLHGPGPSVWRNRRSPFPEPIGVDDILVPAGTTVDMETLDYLSIYREMTWSQLYEATHGPCVDKGWNTAYVETILANLYKQPLQPVYQGNRWLFPEKLQEDVKSNAAQMASSALPKALLWDFFFRSEDSGKWSRRILLDFANLSTSGVRENSTTKKPEFLYEREDYADDWSEVIHFYVGNCSNVAPFRYHSIRSIGYLLYGVSLVQNKLRCRLADHMMQALLTLFRNVSDDDREKLGLVDLQNFGIVPDGVSMVTAAERHEVDTNLIMMGLNQGRQLMSESSASFLPDMSSGGERRSMTATETLIRQQSSVNLTSAVLGQIAEQSEDELREITRRFFDPTNPAPECKRFREAVQRDGVPLDFLEIDAVEIIPEKTAGGGNKAVEIAATQAMMEMLPLVGPDAQRIIMRKRFLALGDDPMEAVELVPEVPKVAPDDVQYAQMGFIVMMQGLPFEVRDGVNMVVFASTLLQMMQTSMQQLTQMISTPMGVGIAAERFAGLGNVAGNVEQAIQKVAMQGKAGKQQAAQLQQGLQNLLQILQQVGEQLQKMEQEGQPQQGMDPKAQAEIQAMMAKAQVQSRIDENNAAKKQQHKDVAFMSENVRRTAMAQADIQRLMAKTAAEMKARLLEAALAPAPAAKGSD